MNSGIGTPSSDPIPTVWICIPSSRARSSAPFDLTFVVLTVGDHDEHPMVPRPLLERIQGYGERFAQVGPLDGDQTGDPWRSGRGSRTVIHGERALDEGVPGEGDEADTVSVQALKDAHDFQACPLQPVRRQHPRPAWTAKRRAPPSTSCPSLLTVSTRVPNWRTSKGQDEEGDRQQDEDALGCPRPSAQGSRSTSEQAPGSPNWASARLRAWRAPQKNIPRAGTRSSPKRISVDTKRNMAVRVFS